MRVLMGGTTLSSVKPASSSQNLTLAIDKGREGLKMEILSALRVTSLWRIGAMQAGALWCAKWEKTRCAQPPLACAIKRYGRVI